MLAFPVGKLAVGEDVVDREAYMWETTSRLESGQSVMIAGPRRIGKTSVGREMLRQLQLRGHDTVVIDLFAVSDVEDFATQLLKAIVENHTGTLNKGMRKFSSLLRWMGRPEVKTKLGPLEIGLEFSSPSIDPETRLLHVLEWAERGAHHRQRTLIVMFDEFQDVQRIGGESLIKKMRATMQTQQRVSYLFLGSEPSLMKTLFANQHQAFYRFALFSPLPSIPDEAWEQYITGKITAHGGTITTAAMKQLLHNTGGHPYGMMGEIQTAWLMAMSDRKTTIDADVIHFADEQTMEQLQTIFEQQQREVRKVSRADAVLQKIAQGEPPYSLPVARSVVAKALLHLQDVGVIAKTARGEYTVWERMFARWLTEK